MRVGLAAMAAVALFLLHGTAVAKPACNDADLFGSKLLTGICWTCVLPVRMFGLGNDPDAPSDPGWSPVCNCPDPLGVPRLGTRATMWLPYRLVETVRAPWCSPSMGGIFVQNDFTMMGGAHSRVSKPTSADYYHTHLFSFPLARMLGLLINKECDAGGYADMDLITISEVDPTANDTELSLFLYFETALYANPLAVAACMVDCTVETSGKKPTPGMFHWCAGCNGSIYPLTNFNAARAQAGVNMQLMAARSVAVSHRRGLGHRTYGSDSMCGGKIDVRFLKEQYKWSQVFPLAEAAGPRCCHWTGESVYKWGGDSRQIPVTGEDRVFMLWRYTDCCVH